MSEDDRRETDRETMADVSHTHPHTGETFGSVYRRGPAVADGGRTDGDADAPGGGEGASETMRDVDHTPPHGEGANEVWTRGRETDDAAGDRTGSGDASGAPGSNGAAAGVADVDDSADADAEGVRDGEVADE